MLIQPKVRVGDTITASIWVTGTEDRETIETMMDSVLQEIARLCEGARVGATTPPEWHECFPGDGRVDAVPDHIQGPNVRAMVAEVQVLSILSSESRFLAELEPSDLRRLRKITRKAHRAWWNRVAPGRKYEPITDRQADTLINDLGPEAALEAMRKGWTRLAGEKPETVH